MMQGYIFKFHAAASTSGQTQLGYSVVSITLVDLASITTGSKPPVSSGGALAIVYCSGVTTLM